MKISSLQKWASITNSWPQILLLKLGIKNDDINLKMKNGLKLTLMNRGEYSDTAIVSDLYFNIPYTKNDFAIKDNWIIIDIGANVGIFSTYAIKQARDVRVFAYEAAADNFKYLQKNIEQNNLSEQIKAFNYAVTGKSGESILLFMHKFGSGGNSLYSELSSSERTAEVPTISLNDIIMGIPQIDLIKVDCEGAEYDILLNTNKDTMKKIKKIVIEHHEIKGHDKKELELFLQNNGFITFYNDSNMLCAVNTNEN